MTQAARRRIARNRQPPRLTPSTLSFPSYRIRMGSRTPVRTSPPPDVLPNGLATVASLHLPAFLSAGFGPAGPPPGFLARLTYSVHDGRLFVTFPPGLLDGLGDKIGGGEYDEQPVVGWKDGIRTRPVDYVTYSTSSHPFRPGDHPLAEAAADVRLVGTVWDPMSDVDRAKMKVWMRENSPEGAKVPAGYRCSSNESLPLDGGGGGRALRAPRSQWRWRDGGGRRSGRQGRRVTSWKRVFHDASASTQTYGSHKRTEPDQPCSPSTNHIPSFLARTSPPSSSRSRPTPRLA